MSDLATCARKGCHKLVKFSNTELCDDCFADRAAKYHGSDTSVAIPYRSQKEMDAVSVSKFTKASE